MYEMRFPKMGMSALEVDVIQLFVHVGQTIRSGDHVVEVEGDKAIFRVDSEFDGTVASVLVEVGGTYDVGDVICTIVQNLDD